MVLIDVFTRLCGTKDTTPPWTQAVTDTAPGAVTDNWLDLDPSALGANRTLGGGQLVVARFEVMTAATSGGDPDNTVELQIVRSPMTLATPTTARTFTFNSTTAVDDTTETITKVAHGLTNNTRVTSSGTPPTGFTTATWYYVINATADTFQISATPGGSAANLTVAVGTCTLTWYPEVVVSSGAIPFHRLVAGAVYQLPIPPLIRGPSNFPLHRYLYGMFVGPTDIAAVVFTCDLVAGFDMDNKPLNRVGYATA